MKEVRGLDFLEILKKGIIMSILNNDVLVQETPTKLTLETVLDYVLDKTGINITKYPTATETRK